MSPSSYTRTASRVLLLCGLQAILYTGVQGEDSEAPVAVLGQPCLWSHDILQGDHTPRHCDKPDGSSTGLTCIGLGGELGKPRDVCAKSLPVDAPDGSSCVDLGNSMKPAFWERTRSEDGNDISDGHGICQVGYKCKELGENRIACVPVDPREKADYLKLTGDKPFDDGFTGEKRP